MAQLAPAQPPAIIVGVAASSCFDKSQATADSPHAVEDKSTARTVKFFIACSRAPRSQRLWVLGATEVSCFSAAKAVRLWHRLGLD